MYTMVVFFFFNKEHIFLYLMSHTLYICFLLLFSTQQVMWTLLFLLYRVRMGLARITLGESK